MAEEYRDGKRVAPIGVIKKIIGVGSDLKLRGRARNGELGAEQVPLHPGTASSRFKYLFDVEMVLDELREQVDSAVDPLHVKRNIPNLFQMVWQILDDASAPVSVEEAADALVEQHELDLSEETVEEVLGSYSAYFEGEDGGWKLSGREFPAEAPPAPAEEPAVEEAPEEEPAVEEAPEEESVVEEVVAAVLEEAAPAVVEEVAAAVLEEAAPAAVEAAPAAAAAPVLESVQILESAPEQPAPAAVETAGDLSVDRLLEDRIAALESRVETLMDLLAKLMRR